MNTTDLLFFADATTENAAPAGYVAGAFLGTFLYLLGALKCWSISRRPTTNTKSALALMIVLGTMSAASLVGGFVRMALVPPLFPIACGPVWLIGWLAGIVLAIMGLVEITKNPAQYTQGRSQSIWSIVLGVFLMVVVSFNTAQSVFNVSHSKRPPGKTDTFTEFNFSFRDPGGVWVPFPGFSKDRQTRAGYTRRFPNAYFFVIPEKVDLGDDFDSARMADIGEANLEAAARSSEVLLRTNRVINGLPGVWIETKANVNGYEFIYEKWYYASNRYAYQLVGYGAYQDRKKLKSDFETLYTNFNVLKPARLAPLAGGFTSDYFSVRYPYRMHVKDTPWHDWTGKATTLPEAEFGVINGNQCMAVVPVWLRGETLEPEALIGGLMGAVNVQYPNESGIQRSEVQSESFKGVEVACDRTVGGNLFHYRFRVTQSQGVGYLVAAWTTQSNNFTPILEDAVKRFELTAKTPELSSGTEFGKSELKTQSVVLNGAGLYHFSAGEYDRALALFQLAAQVEPTNRVYVANALLCYRNLKRYAEALVFIDKQSAALQHTPDVRLKLAFFQSQTGQVDAALTNYAAIFEGGYRNELAFEEYLTLLNRMESYDRGLAAVEAYLKIEDTTRVRQLHALEYRFKKQYPKAIEILKAELVKSPFDIGVISDLADVQIVANQFADALETSQKMVRAHPDSAYAYFEKGKSEVGLKWYREAKATFEKAAKLAPTDSQIQSYLDYVSRLLGEGNNSQLKEPIDPVPVPGSLTDLAEGSVSEKMSRKFGGYYSRHVIAMSYEPGKELKTTEYFRARILDASGVTLFSTLQRPFDPLLEEVYINDVSVLDASGAPIATGSVSNYYVLDHVVDNIASTKKMLNMPIPGLRPGCQLCVTMTFRERGVKEMRYMEHYFARSIPVHESLLYLRGDLSGIKFQASPGVEEVALPEGRCWRAVDPLVAQIEPYQSPASGFLMTLRANPESARWHALVTNYLDTIAGRLEPNPDLVSQAARCVAGLSTDDEKIFALSRFVQTNLTYKAIEFGRRALIPNAAIETLHNRYGDCKDHALLLQQMLLGVGIPARLALVWHGSIVQEDFPSFDQFDHMIVFVPADGRFIDCTSKGNDPAHSVPMGQAGRLALVLDPATTQPVRIPADPGANVESEKRIAISPDGDAVINETLTLTGTYGGFLRSYLMTVPQQSRAMLLHRDMELNEAEIVRLDIGELEAPEKPLQVICQYKIKRRFHQNGDRLLGSIPLGLLRVYLKAEPVEDRVSPFEITIPVHFRSTVALEGAAGWQPEPLAGLDLKTDPRYLQWTQDSKIDGRTLKMVFDMQQQPAKFKAGEYDAFRETLTHAVMMMEREATLHRVKS